LAHVRRKCVRLGAWYFQSPTYWMISRVRSGCSNISTLRDCDVQSVTQRGVASSGTPRPVGSLSTVVWSVRASTTSIIRYALREETLAPLAGGFALARGSQRGIELEVGPGAWRRKPLHGARALRKESYRRTPEGFNRRHLWETLI